MQYKRYHVIPIRKLEKKGKRAQTWTLVKPLAFPQNSEDQDVLVRRIMLNFILLSGHPKRGILNVKHVYATC